MTTLPDNDERPRVLIVDDDSWTARAVSAALEDSGEFRVLPHVHSGEDAVTAYASLRPDIVLMDVNMPPGMSGADATSAIIEADPEATIILLTTVSPGPGISRALEAGAIAVVQKTAADDELVAVVRAATAGESPALLRTLAEDIIISGDILPDAPAVAPSLTPTELALLQQLCRGLDYTEIASEQHVSINTLKTHAQNLRAKLDAKNLAQLIIRALQYKYFSPE